MAVKAQGQITLSAVVDVSAAYRYYLLQASTLSAPYKPTAYPPSGWDDTEPTYTEGSTNSLYLVDCTVFSDGTWAYSEVSLSSAYEAAKAAYNKAVNAQSSVDALDKKLDPLELFNRLTDNGTLQGLYKDEDGNICINATYIKSGQFLADLIKAGVIQSVDGEGVIIDLNNGTVAVTGTFRTETLEEDGATSYAEITPGYVEVKANDSDVIRVAGLGINGMFSQSDTAYAEFGIPVDADYPQMHLTNTENGASKPVAVNSEVTASQAMVLVSHHSGNEVYMYANAYGAQIGGLTTPASDHDAANKEYVDDQIKGHVAYGTCSTAAATAAKVITTTAGTWSLTPGSIIVVKFSATNTASNPTFNVNGTGAKSVWYSTALITTGSLSYAGYANRPAMYMFDGTQYVFLGWSYDANTTYTNVKLGHGYGTCATAAATTAKVVTLSSYTLVVGGIVAVKFTYAVPAGATMNVNSKGAKAIYHKGAAIKAGVINAGDTATFIYNGSYYHLLSVDRDDNTVYTHPSSGVTAGTYRSVTVNAAGHVTGGANPTTLAGYGITDAAPAGYGLGTTAKLLTSADDLDDIYQSGWYRWTESPPANAPTIIYDTCYGFMRVDGASDGTVVQTIYSGYSTARGIAVTRQLTGGATDGWEWVNPPMVAGVEYRTTERYHSKPVYTKLVNCGTISSNTLTTVAYSDDTNCRPIFAGGGCVNAMAIQTGFYSASYTMDVGASFNNILIKCGATVSDLPVIVKYYKTTD